MKIHIRKSEVDVTDVIRVHVERRLGLALARFADQIGRVIVRFSNADGDADGAHKRCRIEVGLRPEDLRIGPAGSGSVDLNVDFVEELGATQLFHGKVEGAEFVVQAPTGQIAADARALSLSIDAANVHLFDPKTGLRLGRA